MIEIDELPPLRDPVVVAAFSGWNDAGDAATAVIDHLAEVWGAHPIGAVDPEEFYDFQVVRPTLGFDELGNRRLRWPTTRLLLAHLNDHDVILVQGIEPNMRWRQFTADLLATLDELGATLIVSLGALLADVPHTRPLPISCTVTDPDLVDEFGAELSTYEGPTGIVGVIQDACAQLDLSGLSYWVSVPHYVAQPPCPKATLALLGKVEDALGTPIPWGDLLEESRAWERGVDELAGDDEEIADYVRQLEQSRDAAELPEASGEAIAMEFERYLKRREPDGE